VYALDSRKMERFDLALRSRLRLPGMEKPEFINLLTSDVCAGGAFFKTDLPLPIGTEVEVDLVLPLDNLKRLNAHQALIKVSGAVIRSDDQGIAVCFNEDYQISRLPSDTKKKGSPPKRLLNS